MDDARLKALAERDWPTLARWALPRILIPGVGFYAFALALSAMLGGAA